MSFTRAKNPVNDSGFSVTNPREALGDLIGYTLFATAVLFALGLARNQVLPMFNGLVSGVTGGRVNSGGSGSSAWEGW